MALQFFPFTATSTQYTFIIIYLNWGGLYVIISCLLASTKNICRLTDNSSDFQVFIANPTAVMLVWLWFCLHHMLLFSDWQAASRDSVFCISGCKYKCIAQISMHFKWKSQLLTEKVNVLGINGTCFSKVSFFHCYFSVLWIPQTRFHSPPVLG